MKIVEFHAENVKRLKLVDITPKSKSHPGCGATRLTVQERAALRAYIGQLGYRGAVRELGVARGTLTTAVLGGAMRNSTAFLLRARVLAAQSTPPEPQP